jgi:hypothetical protein
MNPFITQEIDVLFTNLILELLSLDVPIGAQSLSAYNQVCTCGCLQSSLVCAQAYLNLLEYCF